MRGWHAFAPSAAIHLPMTLCGGQCFRWRRTPRGTWVGVVRHTAYELCDPLEAPVKLPEPKEASQNTSQGLPLSSTGAASSFSFPVGGAVVGKSVDDFLWFRCLSRDLSGESDATQQGLFLRHYLALDVDLREMWRRWTTDNPMKSHPLVKFLAPRDSADIPVCIRHLRQDLHETLLGFLCSQNNNVTRITSLVERLSTCYGDYLCDYNMVTGDVRHTTRRRGAVKQTLQSKGDSDWIALHALPSMDQLARATEEGLRALGFGYRSKYLTECAAIICKSGATDAREKVRNKKKGEEETTVWSCSHVPVHSHKWYEELTDGRLTLQERREKLMALPGVGRKVADCILLFALGHHELVPVDTHMAQVAAEYLTTPVGVSSAATKRDGARVLRELKRGREADIQKRAAAANDNGSSVPSSSWESTLMEWYRNGKGSKAKFPALLLKHHDAIQQGFKSLFGDYCGWAHSILFYTRMRSLGKREAAS